MNSFALVGYVPEPLAGFVDGLRRQITPGYRARAHVTVLPPRPLACDPAAAWEQIRRGLHNLAPFRVELKEIRLFAVSGVIYIALGDGFPDLEGLHSELNHGCVAFKEPWPYKPHLTLAQDLKPDLIGPTMEMAAAQWNGFSGPRGFLLDHLTFVQETERGGWMDLDCCDLRPALVS